MFLNYRFKTYWLFRTYLLEEEALDIAKQLTLLEFGRFESISPSQFYEYLLTEDPYSPVADLIKKVA